MSKVVNTLDDPAKPPLLHPSGATEHGARGKVLFRGTIFDCGALTQTVDIQLLGCKISIKQKLMNLKTCKLTHQSDKHISTYMW